MKQSIFAGISALLMAVLMPVLLLSPAEAGETEDMFLIISDTQQPRTDAAGTAMEAADHPELEPEPQTAADKFDTAYTIRLKTGSGIETLSLDAYLTGVVLAEMPASFELEALKAQAVAARTFTLRQIQSGKHEDCDVCSDSTCCQAWIDEESLQQKLGSAWSQYWEKAARAVSETDGEVLTYDGALIDAVYFSCSGGRTEDAAAVWGSEIPYLQSVDSAGEEYASKYQSEVSVPLDRFQALIAQQNEQADLTGTPTSWFGPVTASEGGGVYTMEIGGQTFYGTALRSLFGLNSTLFTVAVEQDAIVFEVLGYGHRVGMSQYGANAMAAEGKRYDEILLHYYSGVTLSQASDIGTE